MATFRMCQCQDGDEVLKFYEWRCQGIKRRFRKTKDTEENVKNSNRYFIEQFWIQPKPNSILNFWERGVLYPLIR